MNARFKTFDTTKKIQAIKVQRSLTGIGLKESKDYVDSMCAMYNEGGHVVRPGDWFEIRNGWEGHSEEAIRATAVENHVTIEFDKPREALPINKLALKLAMHGFSVEQVESLADALFEVEDAEGSLRAASKLMQEVA